MIHANLFLCSDLIQFICVLTNVALFFCSWLCLQKDLEILLLELDLDAKRITPILDGARGFKGLISKNHSFEFDPKILI